MKKNYITIFSILLFTVLLTINSDMVFNSALTAMKNSILKIIPSLFPYMVISSMIISSGAANLMGKIFPVANFFGLPSCASAPILIGALCGFPLGAKSASELYEKGYLNKTETEILISISNNTGPSFLIFVIGGSYWQDISFGIFLYIAQLISSLVAGLIINKLLFKAQSVSNISIISPNRQCFSESLSQAITSASISAVYICGFITFFAVINALIANLFVNLSDNIRLLLCALLEFSEAASLTSVNHSLHAYFICGFAVGWSGLSVFFQTAGFTNRLGLSLKRCVVTKLLQGVMLGISCAIYGQLFYNTFKIECFSDIQAYNTPYILIISPMLITLYVIYCIKKHKGA